MPSKQIALFLRVPLASLLLPVLCFSQAPYGITQVRNNAIIAQILTAQEVDLLIENADQFQQAGDYASAAEIWEKLVENAETTFGAEHPTTATRLNNLAFLYQMQGFYGSAEPLYSRVLAIDSKTLGPDHPDVAAVLNNLAALYVNQGLHAKAKPLYQRALAIREKRLGSDHPDTAISLNNLAFLLQEQGLYEKAESLYERALDINKKVFGTSHLSIATCLSNIAALYVDQGLYGEAEPLQRRALEIRETLLDSDHPDIATSLNHLANLYTNQGYYAKAELAYKRALKIREQAFGIDHRFTATILSNLAVLYQKKGMLGSAQELYEQVLKIDENKLDAEHPLLANSLNNLAALHQSQGLYEKARPLYERALMIREKKLGFSHPDTAVSLNNLAYIHFKQGFYVEAERLYLRSLEIKEQALGIDHPDYANSLNNLALLYNSRNWFDKSAPLYERALKVREQALGLDHPDTALSLNNLASLYLNQGLLEKAASMYRRALLIRQKALGLDHPSTITSINNLASLYDAQGLFTDAEILSRSGFGMQIKLMHRELPMLPRSERQAYISKFRGSYEYEFSYASKKNSRAKLALFTRLNRQGLLEELEKRQAQLASLPGEQQQVAEELRALTQQLSSLTIKPEQRNVLKVRQENLEKQLYRLLPQLKPRVVEVEQVAAVLPADGVLIEFQRYRPFDQNKLEGERWGAARYMAMVLKPNGMVSVVDLGDAAVLDQAITAAVSTARQAQEDAAQKLEVVSQLLLEPLKQATAGSKTWFVSPDGELNRLPFAALQVPGGKGYLAEAVDLRLLTTGRELLDLQQPKPSAKSAALVLADPAYDRRGAGVSTAVSAMDRGESSDHRRRSSDLPEQLKWDRLPATAKEGETVKVLTGGSLLVQQQATAEAVKAAPAPKILHLATHAFYLPNQPQQQPESGTRLLDQRGSRGVVQVSSLQGESPLLRSGIALAGANQPNADPKDDGYLTALEVAQLSWEGTDLVVISACESGLGDLQVGEGVYGLKRAIAVAGARSSLLSLWKVDDYATKKFMEGFYARLKEGKGKAEALAETQKEFRESPVMAAYNHPYYWAAFQLSGDWGPVKGI